MPKKKPTLTKKILTAPCGERDQKVEDGVF